MCFLSFVSDEPNEAGCRSKRKGSLTPVHAGSFFIYFFFQRKPRDFGLTLTLSFMTVIRFSGNTIAAPPFLILFSRQLRNAFFFFSRFDI